MSTGAKPASPSSEPGRVAAPSFVPDHELLHPIGAGSYGEVWLARNVVGTLRAVKVVYRKTFENDRPYEREYAGIQKFEPLSRSHEGFVDILQMGRNDAAGCFYYVMELADASETVISKCDDAGRFSRTDSLNTDPLIPDYSPKTLRSEISRRTRLPFDECVTLGLSLARALAHLHAAGLVHRDIKPSNIIFVDGVPKLADIGLVTDAGDGRSYVGTEGFIPPEGPGTPGADLFSLGKVLYEASTGKDRQDFPDPLTHLGDQPDKDRLLELNAILHKACAPDVSKRYQNAEEMLGELELLQAGRSVRDTRTRRRQRSLLGKLAAALAVTAVLVATGTAIIRHLGERSVNPSDRLSKDPLAVKEYREGMHCARRDTTEGFRQAIEHFKRAIEMDPKFAMAYNGLFETYLRQQDRLGARQSVAKMIELEPNLAEAHAGLGLLAYSDWNWPEAERHFQHAIELNPRCAIAHMRYGYTLLHAGRTDESRRELLIAERLDPTFPRAKKNLGHVYYVERRFREAIAQYQQATNLEPSYPMPHRFIGQAWRALGDYAKSIEEMEIDAVAYSSDELEVRRRFSELRAALATGGTNGYWRAVLKQGEQSRDLYSQSQAWAHLNEYTRALDLLGAYCATNSFLSCDRVLRDECWDPVHNDPRFIALLRKAGFRK